MNKVISKLKKTKLFNNIDIHFAKFIGNIAKDNSPVLLLSTALVSRHISKGNICFTYDDFTALAEGLKEHIEIPSEEKWKDTLLNSSVVGKDGGFAPLIFDGTGLYLHRYWKHEKYVGKKLISMAGKEFEVNDYALFLKSLETFFEENDEDINWQRVAAFMALRKQFSIISGGPGTGKTTTVAKILCLLLEQDENFKIALTAPTGKAAARMNEAISRAAERLKNIAPEKILKLLPQKEGKTIHRLLGRKSFLYSDYYNNEENKLKYDMVIVDEASMIDLSLMKKLLSSLRENTRLILLGDKDQLASVEAGSVLGDIFNNSYGNKFSKKFCQEYNFTENHKESQLTDLHYIEEEHKIPLLIDCTVQLQKSYRFKDKKGIGILSSYINSGKKPEEIMKVFKIYNKNEGIGWNNLPGKNKLKKEIKEKIVRGFSAFIKTKNPEEAMTEFNKFRVLCAMRRGPFGVLVINNIIENILKEEKLISPEKEWYENRPVMITCNDYTLKLFNGDTGIVRKDEEGSLKVYFPSSGEEKIKKYIPESLPDHETVFAMTIHKSQGSEFEALLMILPDRINPVLTKELIYTGITRAKKNIEIIASREIFKKTITREVKRTSGLKEALWNI